MRADRGDTGGGVLRVEDVEAAARALAGRVVRTPCVRAAWLDEHVGASVYLKAELLQHTGSFKVRGVLNRLARMPQEERERGVIAVSAGNHAQALAYGCQLEEIDCAVVMWDSASQAKKSATIAFGATVDDSATGPAEAFRRVEEIRAESGRVLIHPFGDPAVVAGQGTVGLELRRDVPDLDAVVVPVGGGGLVCGIAAALRSGGKGPRIIGVEPRDAAALAAGVDAGKPVTIEPSSVDDGLLAPFTTQLCIDLAGSHGIELLDVSEPEITAAMRQTYARGKLACEPAAAAGVAAVLSGKVTAPAGTSVAVVVSGGNVATSVASDILAAR